MSGEENSSTDSAELPRVSPIAEDILHQIAAAGDQQITLFPLHQDLAIPKYQQLSDQSYIETWTPDGPMTARLDGQQRAFPQSMHVALTETGQQYLDQYYSATAPATVLDNSELTRRPTGLEEQHEVLEDAFTAFRQPVRRALRDE